jgi:P27 family predicted phage terminase small subunit
VARKKWDEIGVQLLKLRVITAADATALELLCGAYAEYFKASAVVQRRGATYKTRTDSGIIERRRPEVAIAADAWKRVRSMLLEFGISPASRTKVHTVPDQGELPFGGKGAARFIAND